VLGAHYRRQVHYVAKKEFCDKNRLTRFLTKHLGAISIDRSGADLSSVKAILNTLKNENCVGIFPEGTRNKTDTADFLAMKPGAVRFALKADSPVVPMVHMRAPKLLRRNYGIIGDPITFKAFAGVRVCAAELDAAHALMVYRMAELQALVRFYAAAPRRFRKEMRKEFRTAAIPMKNLVYKYNIKVPARYDALRERANAFGLLDE
jgi:1-acyl-sn-glycerol-3-phosphate acyltransferase